MSIVANKNKLLKSIKFYSDFLKTVDEETFLLSPPDVGWSLSEVYSHILSVNFFSRIAMEKCLNKTAEIKTRKPDWRVRLILFLGKFPPGKLKAPDQIASVVKKISKEDASNQLIKLQKKIEGIDNKLPRFHPDYKMKHPRLGYLDAKSWLRFMLVHNRHHEKQILRIGKKLT